MQSEDSHSHLHLHLHLHLQMESMVCWGKMEQENNINAVDLRNYTADKRKHYL